MAQLNYQVLKESGYDGFVLAQAPEKVMQFGEGNFLRAFVDNFIDIANEKAGFNGKAPCSMRFGPPSLTSTRPNRPFRRCTTASHSRPFASM